MSRVQPTAHPDSSVCSSTNAAMSLLFVMEHLSSVHFGSPWAQHLDHRLWREAHAPQKLSPYEANSLKYLSTLAGGWWSWVRDEATGPTFLPTNVWRLSLRDR